MSGVPRRARHTEAPEALPVNALRARRPDLHVPAVARARRAGAGEVSDGRGAPARRLELCDDDGNGARMHTGGSRSDEAAGETVAVQGVVRAGMGVRGDDGWRRSSRGRTCAAPLR